jgi:nucleoside-diphosphate-sugar epimerase
LNIFISGSTGFVGTNLIQYLKESFNPTIFPITRDMFLKNAYPKLDGTIIHLAGKAHDLKNSTNNDEYQFVNVDLTKKIFNAFLDSEADVFIFISSVKAAADKVDDILFEDAVPSPNTSYGISKLNAEKYLLSIQLPPNKKLYILRPVMIHGPGNKGNLNLLYNLVKMGMPYPLGAYYNQRTYLSVENFCFIITEFIQQKNITSGIYNISDSNSFSTIELIQLMSEVLEIKTKIWSIPKIIIKTIATLGDLLKFPFNTERLDKLTDSYLVSNQKLLEAIKKPLPIQGSTGLIKTFKSFQSNS